MERIGTKQEGLVYKKREAAYAIIKREEDNKVAIAKANGYFFFFGGGIEGEETPIEALKRELLEETGYQIKNIQYFDKITAWADGIEKGPLDITATIYIAQFDEKVTEPIEKDHFVIWVNPEEYADRMCRPWQKYIMQEYIKEYRK